MADEDFDFRPAERREARTFEPPPWEKDQFDALVRQRAEPATPMPAAEKAAVPAAEKATVPADEATVERMLAELAVEEPKATASFWKASVFVGAALVIFGSVFVIWGIAGLVAAKGSGMAGVLGGSVMLLFGAGFVFGGLYVVVKNLRQQGVL